MKAIHIDARTGEKIPAHEIRSGLTGFCSWRRFSQVLRDAQELKPTEELLSIQIDARGITFRVR